MCLRPDPLSDTRALLICCAVFLALLTGCFKDASATSARNAGGLHKAEVDDLLSLPDADCTKCFVIRFFDRTFPVPSRYAIIPKTGNCIHAVSPPDVFLRRLDTAGDVGRMGVLEYCPAIELDKRIAALEESHPVVRELRRANLQIKLWGPQATSRGETLHVAYIRSENMGLFMRDSNPLLWDAMITVAERTDPRNVN